MRDLVLLLMKIMTKSLEFFLQLWVKMSGGLQYILVKNQRFLMILSRSYAHIGVDSGVSE